MDPAMSAPTIVRFRKPAMFILQAQREFAPRR
jgi:hypothetical protein